MKRNQIYALAGLSIFALMPEVQGAQSASGGEQRYAKCMDMAERAPDSAINEALIWQNEQGGVPARHCEALGLFHLKEFAEAAARLERIAEDMRTGRDMPVRGGKRLVASGPMLADMYGQAANAWLLAGEVIRAETAIDSALSLVVNGSSQEAELIIDRSRIAAADEDFELALSDLEKVLARDPGRKDILVLAAAGARGVGDYLKAEKYLSDFLSVFPESPEGHLERGNLSDVQGNIHEARRAWLKVIGLQETGKSADAARQNLERIDIVSK